MPARIDAVSRARQQVDRRQRGEEAASELASELETERGRQGLTYYDIAMLCGMSQQNLRRTLIGEERPRLARFAAIADALGCRLRIEKTRGKR